MNKLFTKVAALTLGVAMAAGVGVALGSAKVSEVKATEAAAYTLDGMHQETGTSYNGDNEVTQSNVTWIVNGNVNQTPWRIGGKNTNGLDVAGTIRKIQSQSAVTTEDVSKVVVSTALPSNNSLSPTAVSLKVGTGIGGSQTSTVSGTFGNTITFERPTSADWSSKYFEIDFTMPQNNTGTQKYFQVSSVVFYYESTTPRGTLEITQVPHILKVGSSFTPGMNWTPASGTSATISESEFSSSDEEVLSKDGNAFSALKAGYATITLSATDSLSEQYSVVSHKVYVTNDNAFDVGDKVAIIASDVTMELSGISDTSTPYGTGAAYENNPAGSFELEVESGSIDGSFAFKHTSGYLNWSAGNSLSVADSKSDNSSWYVIDFDSYEVIKNCADETREIWWNNGSPRFACYTNKTPESDGYNAVSVYKIPDTPVPTEWDADVKEDFENALDGFVPPYLGAVGESEPNISDGFANYTVQADVLTQANTYLSENQWTDKGGGNWTKATTNGLIEAYVAKVEQGTYFGFQYTANITVTVVQDSHQDQIVMQPGEFTLPAHNDTYTPVEKEFKAWLVGEEEKAEDAKINVTTDTIITAVYQDKAQGWSAADKQALETALHGYLPPYFGELVEDLSTTENSASFTVYGDLRDQFATKLGDGWNLVSDNNYMMVGDNYYLTASIEVIGVRGWPVGDYSTISFTYHEGQPVQKFTITYKAGYGTGEDIVIEDVEAGSSHTLITFDETQFVEPAGQQFKGWRVSGETELRDPGDVITNIQANVNIFANYEDIPVTDWSDAFKAAYTSRFGSTYLPPFVSAEFADENAMYWFDGYPLGYVSVEGNLLSVAISAFDGQWTDVGDEQNEIYIYCDPKMNGFVQIVYDQDYGTTDLVFAAIGNLALDTTGVDKDYFVGEAVDTTNLTVHPMLYNGTVVPGLYLPSTMWTVSPSTFTEAGAQDVTVTVPDFFTEPVELTYSVNVVAVVAESISVSGQAAKTSYSVGEEWSAEGLVVTAHYNNGTEADVTDQVTWSFDPAETAVEVTSVSAVAHLGDLSSDAVVFDVVVEQSYDADAFAKDLLEMVAPICANYDGKKNNKVALKTVWDTMSQRYSTLSNEEKAKVIAAAAKTDGTDLEKAMAFYNYACKKYGLTKFIEGRSVQALVAEHETGNSILPIVVIVASSVAAITAIGVVIALKRRKALLAK